MIQDEPRPAYRFDPRTREWYRQAMSSATLVRTNPYVFFTTREIGTTLAQRSGIDATVVGADITLQDLSRHLAQSRVTPSAQIALVDRLGFVIAHPNPERLVRPGPGDPTLTRIDDLEDPALKQLLARPGDATRGHMTLPVQGRAWIGGRRSIEVDIGEPLTLVLAAPRDELVAEARGLAQWQLLIGLGILGLTLGLVWLSARRISRPLEMLARSVERIGGGDLDTSLPEVWNPLEVGALRDVTDRMRRMLRGHIEERAARLAEEQRRARELDIARQIQQSMLPIAPPEPLAGRYAIAATLQPAREVGGDLYDFFLLDGRRLVFAIADVADKGMPAALLMARVTGLLRAIGRGDTGPDEILRELDARLSQGNEMCMFVTMACAVLDGESGELRYASAGHERPLLRRLGGATTVLVLEGGPALGLGAERGFPVWIGHLAPGDALVLCTDGVTEAFDAEGVAFGLERFRQVVAETPADALEHAARIGWWTPSSASRPAAARETTWRCWPSSTCPPDVEVDAQDPSRGGSRSTSEPEAVGRAWQWIETILRTRDVPAPLVHDCALATEELLANVVMHAYRRAARRPGARRPPPAPGGDPDPARGRRPAFQSAGAARARPRRAHRRAAGGGLGLAPGQAPRRALGIRARGTRPTSSRSTGGGRRHSSEGAAFELAAPPGADGSVALDIESTAQGRRSAGWHSAGAWTASPRRGSRRSSPPCSTGRTVTSLVFRLRRPRVPQQRGDPMRHPGAQADRGPRGTGSHRRRAALGAEGARDRRGGPRRPGLRQPGGARRRPRHRGARTPLIAPPPRRARHVDGGAVPATLKGSSHPCIPLRIPPRFSRMGPRWPRGWPATATSTFPVSCPGMSSRASSGRWRPSRETPGGSGGTPPWPTRSRIPRGFCVDPEPRYLEVLRRINRLESYHALKHHPRLLGFFERMLGAPVFPHPRVLMRNIFPQRLEYTTKAHQDYPNVQGTTEVYTAWMPLIDCPRELGGLQVARGSHTLGVLEFGIGNGAGGIEILDPLEDRWTGGPMQAGDVLVFHSLTVHKGVENRSDRLRMSIDCRFQRVRDPFNPDNANPDGQPLTWDEVYADWRSDELQYYWTRLPLTEAPFDRTWFDRRDALGFALGDAGDPRARSVLQRIVARDRDPAKRERAQRLLATLDTSGSPPPPTY